MKTALMADPPLLALAGIRFRLGTQTILDGVDLGIAPGERLCLVGRNGAGKSTLLRILAGRADRRWRHALRPARRHHRDPAAGARLRRPCQRGALCLGAALPIRWVPTTTASWPCSTRCSSTAAAMPRAFRRRGAARGAGARTGGEPDVLLLDEPTNHLDSPPPPCGVRSGRAYVLVADGAGTAVYRLGGGSHATTEPSRPPTAPPARARSSPAGCCTSSTRAAGR